MSDATLMLLGALAVEVLLLLLGLLCISWWRARGVRRRDAEAIRILVARVRKGKAEREGVIERFLSTQMGLTGDALEQRRVALWRAETLLLQRFAAVYRQRDAGAAALFDTDVCAALEAYQALGNESGAGDVGPVDVAELERLRADNQRLTDELRVTMETMSRMLNEYSAMFAGGTPDEAAPIAAIVGGRSGSGSAETLSAPAAATQDGTYAAPADGETAVDRSAAGGEAAPSPATGDADAPGGLAVAVDSLADTTAVPDDRSDRGVAASRPPGDATPAAADTGPAAAAGESRVLLEEGPVEVLGVDESGDGDIGGADLDDLFDPDASAGGDDEEEVFDDTPGFDAVEEGVEDVAAAAEEPRQVQAQGRG